MQRAGRLRPKIVAVALWQMAADDDLYMRLDLQIMVGQVAIVADDDHTGRIRCFWMGQSQRLGGL